VGRFLISVKYHAVSKLLKRFETRLRSEAELKAVLSEIHGRLNVEYPDLTPYDYGTYELESMEPYTFR